MVVAFSSVQFYLLSSIIMFKVQFRRIHGIYYPASAWLIQLRAYSMPSVPVPPIILTDMVPRCRLLAAHGPRSCLSVRTQPLTATGAPSQTSTIPYHTRRRDGACLHYPRYGTYSKFRYLAYMYSFARLFTNFLNFLIASGNKCNNAKKRHVTCMCSVADNTVQHDSPHSAVRPA